MNRKTGQHHFSPCAACGGLLRCVTCGCDEDDAYVGGQDCTFKAPKRERKQKSTNVPSLRMIVACHNASGEPDFYFCKVSCTVKQYSNGEHYECAISKAGDEGYDGPFVAMDESDAGGRAILDKFVWDSASTYTV